MLYDFFRKCQNFAQDTNTMVGGCWRTGYGRMARVQFGTRVLRTGAAWHRRRSEDAFLCCDKTTSQQTGLVLRMVLWRRPTMFWGGGELVTLLRSIFPSKLAKISAECQLIARGGKTSTRLHSGCSIDSFLPLCT